MMLLCYHGMVPIVLGVNLEVAKYMIKIFRVVNMYMENLNFSLLRVFITIVLT